MDNSNKKDTKKVDSCSVTLENFLMLFAGKISRASIFSNINTNNSSFPEKWRRKNISACSFWVEVWKARDPDNIFKRNIDYVLMLPNDIEIDSISINSFNNLCMDFEYGFIDIDTRKTKCPTIHIILKDESKL